MKKLVLLSTILAFCMCIILAAPTAALNESNTKGVKFAVTLDTPRLEASDKEQTVVMTLSANSPITLDGIGFLVVCDEKLTIKAIEGNGDNIVFSGADCSAESGVVGWATPNAENISGVTEIAKITFSVPANIAPGEYSVGVKSIEVTMDYGRIWERRASAEAKLKVGGDTVEGTTGAENEDLTFTDVNKADWFYNSVKYVYEREIMKGMSEITFEPGTPTSRAMLVTLLWRLDGSPIVEGENAFEDVDGQAWYSNAVKWAFENQIVMGYDETIFAPLDNITREQMVSVLWRYAKYKGADVETENAAKLDSFVDSADVSEYAKEPVEWALEVGLIQGVDNKTLAPKQTATRAQIATVIMRFDQHIK